MADLEEHAMELTGKKVALLCEDLITARGPADLPAFSRTIIPALTGGNRP
jgi:putative intracellular protease/amidase